MDKLIGTTISGHALSRAKDKDTDEKNIRELLHLPKTKELFYYPDKRDAASKVEVESLSIKEIYSLSNMYTLSLITENGDHIDILSPFFKEMQSSSFVEDYKKQEEAVEEDTLLVPEEQEDMEEER